MAGGSEAKESSIAGTIVAVLDDAGAIDALGAALTAADLRAVPERPEELASFLEGPLSEALVGCVHPTTAALLVEDLLHRLIEADRSGTRARPSDPPPAEIAPEHAAPTLPPPPNDEAQGAYEDLASGAVHDRATPAWGIRRNGAASAEGAVWILVSNDHALLDHAKVAAPPGVDVIAASSMAVLEAALNRVDGPGCSIVVDTADPSVALDRALHALTEHSGSARILLWRMEPSERARLAEAVPYVQTWLPCGAEVTAAELVQLLGV